MADDNHHSSSGFKKFLGKNRFRSHDRNPKTQTAPALSKSPVQTVRSYIKPLVLTVEETWEAPDSDQYDHAYQGYLEELHRPIDAIEQEIQQKLAAFRCKVEQMVEIAPDLFDKALSRSAFETGYLIERGGTHDK